MPEILHKCVEEVMANGHDEQSAYAICRTSLGLAEDGSQDDMLPPETSFSLADQAVMYKDILVAHAGKNFVNGDQEFDLTVADMDQMVKNFTAYPRQVPLLLGGGHRPGPYRAEVPADGWVESIKRNGTDLWAHVKLIGAAALAVHDDRFRGVSIGAYNIPDLHGNSVGLRLDHLLITNAGFFADLNIAAQAAGNAPRFLYLTASKEAKMADDKKDKAAPAAKADAPKDLELSAKLEAAEILLQEKDGTIRELTASRDNLLEEVKAFRTNSSLELATKEIDKLKRNNLAEKVRRITSKMRADNQISREALQGWYDHDSDEVVLAGFKNSQFKGNVELLQYHRDSVPKRPGNRSFVSGDPGDGEGIEMTAEEKKQAEAAGKNVAVFAETRKAKNYSDWKRAKKAAAGKE